MQYFNIMSKVCKEVCLIAILYNCKMTYIPSFEQKYYLIPPRNYEEKPNIFYIVNFTKYIYIHIHIIKNSCNKKNYKYCSSKCKTYGIVFMYFDTLLIQTEYKFM